VRGFPVPRNQSAIYLLGTALPLASSIAYNFGFTPYNADATPLVLGLSVMLFMIGFFKVGLLDIVPLARDVIFEGQGDGVLVIDRRGRLTDSNHGMRSILPAIENTEPGTSARDTFIGHGALEELLDRDPPSSIEYEAGTPSGSRIFHVTSALLHGASGKSLGKLLTFHDVTEMKELQRRLETMATHDELTGLYNRRYLNDFAAREIDKARTDGSDFSAIMLDLDYFKRINDTHGHAAGDLVLVAVAKACQRGLRHDDVVGRFGGEELLVLLPRTAADAAGFVAEKLRMAIEACRIPYDDRSIGVTASLGVATLGLACPTLKDLLIAADMALYKAKDSGRNRVCSTSDSSAAGAGAGGASTGGISTAGASTAGIVTGSGIATGSGGGAIGSGLAATK
jgi:diguanylate cyclase (GGDEF)-like protein